ncbi:ester cyclase [Streptosporangium sp. NBC_01639]|uniref:nuclear transport factor 2 family protein n=1 Tax=unclassified Streptosporangium TaxID=2632669 RepID=UPI002DD9D181|nr:nuclear transport factor 2 family protein [Streptosporangium sp. NBC_01756]WSC88566.1 ester cyclase [Streptosporangium sp. NBC_01756]WTD52754.1 ester cyclase [Streptosporangium sp. NBC_01639]
MSTDIQAVDVEEFNVRIFELWSALWNGELGLAEQIMAPQFRLRYAQPGTDAFDQIRHPAQLAEMITQFQAARSGLHFAPDGEAVADVRLIDGVAHGKIARPYLARFTDETGRDLCISGIDMLRIEDGLITEVWSVSGGRAGRPFYND